MTKRLPKGETPRASLSPSKRGFPSIRVTEAVKARLDTFRNPLGLSQSDALSTLLNLAEAPASEGAKVPWDKIREAFLDQFGFSNRSKVEDALYSAGMPKE